MGLRDLNDYDSYEKAVEKGPVSGFMKIFFLIVFLAVVVGGVGYVLGWFGEAAQVAQEEFGPRAALQKYEWFKEQAASIQKADQDVKMLEVRVDAVDTQYEAYGKDRSKWPMHVSVQYNHAKQQARDDLIAVASQRNTVVRDYNAASSKFDWSLFQTRPDKPKESFSEYIVR